MRPEHFVPLGVLAFVVTLIGLMFRAVQVRVEVVGDELLVQPLGLDKLWCVRGRVAVPLHQVVQVRAAERRDVRLSGLRLPGSYLPGVIIAGSYGVGANRVFWNVRRGHRLLVIDCVRGGGVAYRQIVLEVPLPDSTAATLQRALHPSGSGASHG